MTHADDALAVRADPLLQQEQRTYGTSNAREGPNGYRAITRLRWSRPGPPYG